MSFLRAQMPVIASFVVILALLGASAALAPLSLGALGVGLHLLLAFGMVTIIVAVFMRVDMMEPLLRVFALGGLLFLLFMWVIIPVDYFTR